MTTTTTEFVTLFGNVNVPNKKLSLRELAENMTSNYEVLQSITHYCIYFCALKKLELIDLSYADLSAILHKFYSLKNQQIKTTDKSIAYFMPKINKGEINIYEQFKKSSRIQVTKLIDSELDDLFAGL